MDRIGIRTTIIEITADVFGVDQRTLERTSNFTDLPTFNSFRMVEVVERSEEVLDVEVDPIELTPDNLTNMKALVALFERSALRGDASAWAASDSNSGRSHA